MAKLPVNLLLYSLYAASLGLVGGIGWNFYTTVKLRQNMASKTFNTELKAKVEEYLKAGRDAQPARQSWRYDNESADWWKQFGALNITGKLPPAPVEEKATPVEEKKPEDTGVPLDRIVVLEALLLDSSTASAQTSHVVVRYKPEANVQPPPEVIAAAPLASGPARFTPGDTPAPRPAGGPAVGASLPMATGATNELRQFVKLGDRLWPPYNNIRLKSIAEDGLSATFVREDPKVDAAQWKDDPPLFKNELELDAELVKQLVSGRRTATSRPTGQDSQTSSAPGEEVTWQDVADTRMVAPGQVHLSRKDYDYLRDNSEKVLNEDVSFESYTGKYSGQQGIRVGRVSPRVESLGFKAGDVILSVNGEKVKNRAQAINVGRRQYEGGQRRFVVEVLSGNGTGVETRTVVVPNK